MDLKNITIKTKASDKCKSRERCYDSQVLEFDDQAIFFIMSKTQRDIQNEDHFKLDDIASVTFNDHIYLVTNTATTSSKSKYPILYTTKIA